MNRMKWIALLVAALLLIGCGESSGANESNRASSEAPTESEATESLASEEEGAVEDEDGDESSGDESSGDESSGDESSGGEAEAAGDYALYEGDGFALEVPVDWEAVEADGFDVAFAAPREQDFAANLGIDSDNVDEGVTLEQIAERALADLQADSSLSDFAVVEEGPLTLANGAEAYQRVYTWTSESPPPTLEAQQIQLYLLDGQIAYVLTATSLADLFDEYETPFRQMINTFATQ